MIYLKRKKVLLLLAGVLCLGMLFAACVPKGSPDENIFRDIIYTSSGPENPTADDEALAYNEYMTIHKVISITPTNVAVFGQLTQEAIDAGVDSVRVSGGGGTTDVTEVCSEEYFIIPFDLPGTSKSNYAATAMKGEEEIGEPLSFTAPYDSTADTRLDGKGVSVGNESRLYFSTYLQDYLSAKLYTASEVNRIKSMVASTYTAYANRANGAEVALIYVFLPDMTTMDPSVFRAEDVEEKNENLLTRYEQVVSAVRGTRAQVVDMKEILQAELDGGKSIYDLYRQTDSHPTEYTSFLMYREVISRIAAIDEDVVPRTIDDFTSKTDVLSKGGDYVTYRELDPDVITEKITLLEPKTPYQKAVSGLKLYSDPEGGDYSLFTSVDANDGIDGAAERTLVTTDRTPLPNVLVYRDENAVAASLLLADSCDQTMLARSGDYTISLTDAAQYRDKAEKKNVMDSIVVFVSESNLASAFDGMAAG